MTNTTITVDKILAPNFENLLEYLYENEYYKIISSNEYNSIIYYLIDDKIYMATYLFSGTTIHSLDMITIDEEYFKNKIPKYFYVDLWETYSDEDIIKNKEKLEINICEIDKLSFNSFVKLLGYLCSWCGEYGDEILEFNDLGNKWEIKMRINH